nr:DEAD/DEAH box helicase [Desulfogranum marinum]
MLFRHRNGELWAVQAKCYSSEHNITKKDVDKFLSESNRPSISKRLLIATTDRIGGNARQVCDAQEKQVVRYLLSNLEAAEIDYPDRFKDLFQTKRRPLPSPKEHQLEAIGAAEENFQGVNRGQLIMACGTGKTFTTLWIKERLNSRQTLVLLPSLSLLSQTLKEWTFAANHSFEVLCVCSDQTVGKRGEDETIHFISDLAFPVTSSTDEIRNFLLGDRPKVVFSTYQSSPLLAEVQSLEAIPDFDLVIADEAHRCAGKVTGNFSMVLDSQRIRATKRLFATATPRTYSITSHKAAADRGVEVVGMDDETVFGKVLYRLPFSEAIKLGLLTDYRVVIIGVDDPTIAEWIERREIVKPVDGEETDAESLAAQIGLLKAIKDYDLKRIISFQSRVSRAKQFADDLQQTLGWISEKHKPEGSLWSDYVSGAMPTNRRKQKLDQLKAIGENQRGILTNAKCLSEGVDVPSLDGVAFIDPKSSQVDIVQAVGRAIRLSQDKKYGTIVLPVFIKQGEDAITSIEKSNFKPVWEVLNALKAHDEELAFELDQIRTEMGKVGVPKGNPKRLPKVIIDIPAYVDNTFGEWIRSLLVEQITESWFFWYGILLTYVETYGDSRVPDAFVYENKYRLGKWLGKQRGKRKELDENKTKLLSQLPSWTWDAVTSQWEENFEALKKFVSKNGHTRVPKSTVLDGLRLGDWVVTQRSAYIKRKLSKERIVRLNELAKWSWDPYSDAWNEGYDELKKYVLEYGHSLVPISYKRNEKFRLGQWVSTQRGSFSKGKLPEERKKLLEALPKWSWNPRKDAWNKGYNNLKSYVKKYGTCRGVRGCRSFKTEDGSDLGTWVQSQRSSKSKLTEEQLHLLESLPGWVWSPHEEAWEIGYEHLRKYAHTNGDCLVHVGYVTEDNFKLGNWVSYQRQKKNKLSDANKKRLEVLPDWVWKIRKSETNR